jgi:hypothetical protein
MVVGIKLRCFGVRLENDGFSNLTYIKRVSRQKRYADHRRRELRFEVGDFMYLKMSIMRGLRHFKVRGKLAPRFE